ncbi:MAG TPA: hypothetical protein PLE77_01805 [Kiritimatiellia bacterium]|nr:hypothetical protein [Kiritimatiellia bacterium]
MGTLNPEMLKKLTSPEPRLPWVTKWLLDEVWTPQRFKTLTPEDYLVQGEQAVHAFEELLASSAGQFYDELAASSVQAPGLLEDLAAGSAVVVFDGASLREIPLLLGKAQESGFRVLEATVGMAALPSTTTAFVSARLIGKEIAPKTLPQRKELKEKGVRAYYMDDAISTHQVNPVNGETILIWSAFPDITYQDSDARFARHFADMQKLYDTAWRNTVMQIPRGRRIVITSDHGYIFFGAGFDSTRPNDVCALLDQDRFKVFGDDEKMPNRANEPGLQVFDERRLAMLRGRIKNRPKGPSANKVYRHGGLSLMEMLTPWIVLEKE